MYDPQSRRYTPDIQVDPSLPQWIPMGDDQTGQNVGSIGSAFKERFKGGGGAPMTGGYAAPTPPSNVLSAGHEAGNAIPGKSGGAMKSLG